MGKVLECQRHSGRLVVFEDRQVDELVYLLAEKVCDIGTPCMRVELARLLLGYFG